MGTPPFFTDKTVVITGSAGGLGLEMGRRFAEAGAVVVLTDVNAEQGRRAAEGLRAQGARAQFEVLDVRFPDQSVDHIWVAVRTGDDFFKHRKLENGNWTTQAFDLAADPNAEHDVFDASDTRHVAIRTCNSDRAGWIVCCICVAATTQTEPAPVRTDENTGGT